MENLPAEILHAIFINLPLMQKQECMLVSHRWRQIINTHSLFHTIFCDGEYNSTLFIDIIKKKPFLGAQVEVLEIGSAAEKNYAIVKALHLFPNLRVMTFYNMRCTQTWIRKRIIGESVPASLKNRIEALYDSGACIIARPMLSSLCPQLTSLNLVIDLCHGDYRFTNDRKLLNDMCGLLKNLPVLASLYIKSKYIMVKHCELIHANAPLLSSLTLGVINIDEGNINLSEDIEPSTTIRDLSLAIYRESSGKDKWFHYISNKYPQLQRFEASYTHNKYTYNDYTSEFFQFRIPARTFGSNSTFISLEDEFMHSKPSFIHTLDTFGYKLTKLRVTSLSQEIVGALSKSSQCEHIGTLSLMADPDHSFEWLKKMKKLKSLSIECDSKRAVDAATLLSSCPETLESFDSGYDHNLIFDTETTHLFPSIKELKLGIFYDEIKQVDTFISNCFPALTTLSIRLLANTETYLSFEFPSTHFLSLDFQFYQVYDITIELVTLNDGKTRYYDTSGERPPMGLLKFGNCIAPIPKEDASSLCTIHLVCGSVKNLVLDKAQVYLASD